MNELEVKVTQLPGQIDFNFEELKEALELQMTAYTGLEITEDGQKEAKADLATLRKIRKAVDDKRKSIKNEFMQPYTEFEGKAKELLNIIDEPIVMIDTKLKEFEAKRKAEKEVHLLELYSNNIGEYSKYLPYDAVAKPQWLNSTYTDKDVLFDISEKVTKVKSDLDVIKALNSEIEEECLSVYYTSGNNLAAAITKNNDYVNAKKLAEQKLKEEEERKAREEAERIAREEQLKAEQAAKQAEEQLRAEQAEEKKEWVEPVIEDIPVENIPFTEPETDIFDSIPVEEEVTIKIKGKSNIDQVIDYLKFAEIEYEVIE